TRTRDWASMWPSAARAQGYDSHRSKRIMGRRMGAKPTGIRTDDRLCKTAVSLRTSKGFGAFACGSGILGRLRTCHHECRNRPPGNKRHRQGPRAARGAALGKEGVRGQVMSRKQQPEARDARRAAPGVELSDGGVLLSAEGKRNQDRR